LRFGSCVSHRISVRGLPREIACVISGGEPRCSLPIRQPAAFRRSFRHPGQERSKLRKSKCWLSRCLSHLLARAAIPAALAPAELLGRNGERDWLEWGLCARAELFHV
jgi:hypothetical protein